MGKIITVMSALAAINAAIILKGADYVYESGVTGTDGYPVCVYFDTEGNPSCIVGHVFAAHGYGPRDIAEGSVPTGTHHASTIKVEHPGILVALDAAQALQDLGATWGEARNEFLNEIK